MRKSIPGSIGSSGLSMKSARTWELWTLLAKSIYPDAVSHSSLSCGIVNNIGRQLQSYRK